MYTKGDIEEDVSGGWTIQILDPEGTVIVNLHYGYEGLRYGPYVEQMLHAQADHLLSHLNR